MDHDVKKGLIYYNKACDARIASACRYLSSIYHYGWNGVRKDQVKATAFAKRSCDLGEGSSCASNKAVGGPSKSNATQNNISTPLVKASPKNENSRYYNDLRCIPVMVYVGNSDVLNESEQNGVKLHIKKVIEEALKLGMDMGKTKEQVLSEMRAVPHPFPPNDSSMDFCRDAGYY